ncbi:MAG: hypothetical protein BWY71_01462 [Planctomycetes bacterium ADurb.Bin412]|nr:MAG: hypothetical protein BWY71_01462 [Planctomycetes bacterium ADurb.Bin412]
MQGLVFLNEAGEFAQFFPVGPVGDKEEVIVAGAFDPEAEFGFAGGLEEFSAVPAGDEPVAGAVHDQNGAMDGFEFVDIFEFIAGQEGDAGEDAEGGDERAFEDEAGHFPAAGEVSGGTTADGAAQDEDAVRGCV